MRYEKKTDSLALPAREYGVGPVFGRPAETGGMTL